ncbi:unnamed protein product, partial [Chrysoparadoxa australica]
MLLHLSPSMECGEESLIGLQGAPKGEEAARLALISSLIELFKEMDVNGDGICQWDEFTRFVVEKSQIYHKSLSINQMAEYQSTEKAHEVFSSNRSCGPVEQLEHIKRGNVLAVIQEHNPCVDIYNLYSWNHVASMKSKSFPLAMTYVSHTHNLVTCNADMT